MVLFRVNFSLMFILFYCCFIKGFHVNITRKEYIQIHDVKIDENNIHNYLEDHEKLLLFGTQKHKSDVKIVQVRKSNHSRMKRSNDGFVRIKLEENGKEINVELQRSPKLIDDAFILIQRYENSSQFIENSHKLATDYEKCFYHNENSALDLCDDTMQGIFQHNSKDFLIHPLPDRFGENTHIIFEPGNEFLVEKRTSRQNNNEEQNLSKTFESLPIVDSKVFCSSNHKEGKPPINISINNNNNNNNIKNNNKTTMHPTTLLNAVNHKNYGKDKRIKRYISTQWKIPQVLHIETAIFVDKDLFKHMAKNFPKNTENHLIRFVLAMVNGVQLLYHHPSLGHQINFVLKRLEILHSDPKELRRSSDIDVFLNNFCLWQRKLNPTSDADTVHYDHAVILTGLDLYVVGKNGKISSQVVGLAPVAGMCTSTSSCTINEGKHFESVFVVAHEIGHNLGMRHDTSENNCDPSLYIMSPTLGSGKITWSKCSRSYLEAFLETSQAQCLFDRGQFGNSLDHSAEGILPGERFDADQQCMLKYGKDSIRSRSQPLADICRDLHCQRDRYTWTSHPALEGTDCGEMMWCRSGVCSMKATVMESFAISKPVSVTKQFDKINFIEDKKLANLRHEYNFNKPPTWSEWGNSEECDSGCLYGASGRLREGSTGLRVYTRSCLDYRRRCSGRDHKYESCIAKQCYTITKTTIEEFATQICERAKKFDNELTGDGLQNVGDIEESCKVYCRTKENGIKSRSWTFPDGTTCRSKKYEFDDTSYCINGRCERFSCDNSTRNYFKIDITFCPKSSDAAEEVEKNEWNSIHEDNERNHKSVRVKQTGKFENDYNNNNNNNEKNAHDFNNNNNNNNIRRKSDSYQQWNPPELDLNFENNWIVKSGCHFSCMDKAKGIQIVTSKTDGSSNIQLCSPKIIPCDRMQTSNEFAENICSRYKLKVRGLSGYGMQISPSVQDPDRSCRVACQDEFLLHRFYLVNGDYGLFPFGTKCSPREDRYCVNGKCLEFGRNDLPLTQSYISLALYRNKREIEMDRTKRSYLYYTPINITERITQEFLNKIIENLKFHLNITDPLLSDEHIEFTNPIHIAIDELIEN